MKKNFLKIMIFIFFLLLPVLYVSLSYPSENKFSEVTPSLYGITYGLKTFVAVGEYGTIFSSSDGISWVRRESGTFSDLFDVAYGNGTFVAVGWDDGIIVTSNDGVTWFHKTMYMEDDQGLGEVCYGNNIFVVVGDSIILNSPNGIDWFEIDVENIFYMIHADWFRLQDVVYANKIFLAAGYSWNSQGQDLILVSADGNTWNVSYTGPYRLLFSDIAFGKNKFLIVGHTGSVFTSPDGEKWTEIQIGFDYALYGVTYGKKTFVAVGGNDDETMGIILTSPDGNKWTERKSGVTSDLNDVCYGKNMFVVVGDNGIILTSSNGKNWTKRKGN